MFNWLLSELEAVPRNSQRVSLRGNFVEWNDAGNISDRR